MLRQKACSCYSQHTDNEVYSGLHANKIHLSQPIFKQLSLKVDADVFMVIYNLIALLAPIWEAVIAQLSEFKIFSATGTLSDQSFYFITVRGLPVRGRTSV